jgi:hypothetical protein
VKRAGRSPALPDPRRAVCEADFLATAETWNLTTRLGDLDLAFAPAGTAGYTDLRRDATDVEVAEGLIVQVASLEA